MKVLKKEVKSILAETKMVKEEDKSEFLKRFKNITYYSRQETFVKEMIVSKLHFDGIVNYGFWDNEKQIYKMTVYNWGAE